jgi:hypothetical protein
MAAVAGYHLVMSTAEERAARRRAEWTAEVVEPGQRKLPAYSGLGYRERLAAFVELNRRVWNSSGHACAPLARAQWPGEIFEARRRV